MSALLLFAGRYWRVLAIAAAIAAVSAYHGIKVGNAYDDGRAEAMAEMAAKVSAENAATAAREADEREISRAHDIHHQEHARELQSRVDSLTRTRDIDLGRLRQCAAARRDAPAGATPAPAISDVTAWDGGHAVPPAADPAGDLGIELVRYAAECEAYRSGLIDLQAWVTETFSKR